MSEDFEVYKDAAREEEKWLIIDTEGSIFDDNAYIAGELFALRAPPLRRSAAAHTAAAAPPPPSRAPAPTPPATAAG